MVSSRIPSPTISHATHEWRMLFVLLEYSDGLPSQDARTLWLDRLQRLHPAWFASLLQLEKSRERADACGFMRAPAIASDAATELRMSVDSLARESHRV